MALRWREEHKATRQTPSGSSESRPRAELRSPANSKATLTSRGLQTRRRIQDRPSLAADQNVLASLLCRVAGQEERIRWNRRTGRGGRGTGGIARVVPSPEQQFSLSVDLHWAIRAGVYVRRGVSDNRFVIAG